MGGRKLRRFPLESDDFPIVMYGRTKGPDNSITKAKLESPHACITVKIKKGYFNQIGLPQLHIVFVPRSFYSVSNLLSFGHTCTRVSAAWSRAENLLISACISTESCAHFI